MDGAIPAFNADSMRRLTARFNLSSGAGSAHSLQSGLFEQLLSAPPRMERQFSSHDASDANYSIDPLAARDLDSQASSVTHRSDRNDRPDDQSDDDEPSEVSATAAQDTALAAFPVAVPLIAGEDTAVDTPETAVAMADVARGGTGQDGESEGGAAEGAGGAHSRHADTTEQSLADSPILNSEQAQSPVEEAVEIDSFESAAQVQSVASDETASGSSTNKASSQTETQVPTAQTPAAPATNDAAVDTTALHPSSIAAEDEPSPVELGDDQLRHPRTDASDEQSAASTGDTSQVSGQAEAASTDDGKSRDGRREKWFQREASDASNVRDESNTASTTPAVQAGMAADKLSAGIASGHSGSLGEATVSDKAAVDNTGAQTLPDSLAQAQPPTVSAAALAADRRLSALENAAGSGPGGERQLAPGRTVDGIETTQRQSGAPRADAKEGAQDAQRPDVLTQAERVRLVQRVSRSFARLGPMGGQISLKLHPPQLGALNVQVRMEGRSMTAKLTTESGAARDAIMESLPVLRKRLAEQGFEISSFQVEVADTQTDASSGSDNSRSGSELADGRDHRQSAGQGTDYRRLAAQQRHVSDRYDVSPSSVLSSGGAAWELPRGVDVEA